MRLVVQHYGRHPRLVTMRKPGRHARIVPRACTYIKANLDETPQSYVLRLRLHRIQRDPVNETEAECALALVANHWGFSHLGRLSGWYQVLFAELPSETLIGSRRAPPPAA